MVTYRVQAITDHPVLTTPGVYRHEAGMQAILPSGSPYAPTDSSHTGPPSVPAQSAFVAQAGAQR